VADPFPFAFGMNEFTTQPWSFDEDLENYAALGVEAIELCEQKLDEHRWSEQMQRLTESGLAISAVQPLVRTFGASRMQPDPKGVDARSKRLRQSIERLAPFTPGVPFVVNTGAADGGDMQGMLDATVAQLRSLAPFAAGNGVRLALEPLSATSMNSETAIWTLDQASDIIDAVGHPNVGICLDLWNVWQNAYLDAAIARAGSRIFLLQVSDWRMPRSSGDRLVPGDGEIPIGSFLRAVEATGYRGSCTVEIFSQDVPDSLYLIDPSDVIRRSRSGIERAWSQTI
jgi:sugar phosphate isomerase/epimerase